MAVMPEDLIHLLKQWRSVPVASSGDGMPDIAPKTVTIRDPETLVWKELYFM